MPSGTWQYHDPKYKQTTKVSRSLNYWVTLIYLVLVLCPFYRGLPCLLSSSTQCPSQSWGFSLQQWEGKEYFETGAFLSSFTLAAFCASKVVEQSWVMHVGWATVCGSQERNGWVLSCNSVLFRMQGLREDEKDLKVWSEFLYYEVSWGQNDPGWVTESKYHN